MRAKISISPIKVLIVDSQFLMRHILADILRNLENVTVSESTNFTDSKTLIAGIDIHQPDLIMLGVDKLESGEMSFFSKIRELYSNIPVVLLTQLNREGGRVAIEGLKKGAVDYITKPDHAKGLILATQHFQKRVIPILKTIPKLNLGSYNEHVLQGEQSFKKTVNVALRKRQLPKNTELIVISGCVGAVPSLFSLITKLPDSLPVPVVIVQHMPQKYTEILAEELDEVTSLNVREAKDGSILLPGQVYIAPGGFHSVIKNDGTRKRITLHKGPREHKSRPSVDVLLRSAIQTYSDKILAIFLSAGGTDGLLGALNVLLSGGHIFLEDRSSALSSELQDKIIRNKSEVKSYPAGELSTQIMRHLIFENQPLSFLRYPTYNKPEDGYSSLSHNN